MTDPRIVADAPEAAGSHETASRWGWNGDLCAVWGEAILIGETRDEKEARARLFSAAPDLLSALKAVVAISDRNHQAWDAAKAAIAEAEGKRQVSDA